MIPHPHLPRCVRTALHLTTTPVRLATKPITSLTPQERHHHFIHGTAGLVLILVGCLLLRAEQCLTRDITSALLTAMGSGPVCNILALFVPLIK